MSGECGKPDAYDLKRDAMQARLDSGPTIPETEESQYTAVNRACHSYGEMMSNMKITPDLAWEIWSLVENVRMNGFPDELRM